MRNLKRALSLGLTATMISGLMVMGSSAASYADVTSKQNEEAIEVLKTVGIMVGDENGKFNPDAKVTRNEMAVVMCNLLDYTVASYKGTSPFTDVPEWAEPYVAACYTNGITSGYDAKTYGGNDSVTTAQAALMVMKALGYFQYQSDFGADWQLSTVAQGNKIDLFDDVDSGVKEAMTRNDVAQLVLNALECGTVEPETNGSISVGDITIVNDVRYNYVTSGQDYARTIKKTLNTSNDGVYSEGSIVELGEKLYQGDLTKASEEDDFGRPATKWEYQAKEIGTFADEADYTFTAKVTSKALYNEVDKTAVDNYKWSVNVNGDPVDYDGDDLNKNKTDDDKCFLEKGIAAEEGDRTGNGVLTQVFLDTQDDEITVAIINTYLAKAAEDYDEKNEEVALVIYELGNEGSTRTPAYVKTDDTKVDYTVDSEVVWSDSGSGRQSEEDSRQVERYMENVEILLTLTDGTVVDLSNAGGSIEPEDGVTVCSKGEMFSEVIPMEDMASISVGGVVFPITAE